MMTTTSPTTTTAATASSRRCSQRLTTFLVLVVIFVGIGVVLLLVVVLDVMGGDSSDDGNSSINSEINTNPLQEDPTSSPISSPENPNAFDNEFPSASPNAMPSKLPTNVPTISTLSPTHAPTGPVLTTTGSFEVLETLPHDSMAFTQGLVTDEMDPSILYEGTGLYGASSVRIVDVLTGSVLQRYDMPNVYFGEGLTLYPTSEANDDNREWRLIQITWKLQTGFIYSASDLSLLSSFTYETSNTEGWGITYDSKRHVFLVSDGSSNIMYWDVDTLQEINRVSVVQQFMLDDIPEPVVRLNELEWDPHTDTLLANIWQTDDIVRIDVETGLVLTRYNLQDLYTPRDATANVLNGIARVLHEDAGTDEYWITGKLWPNMYRLRLTTNENSNN